MKDFVFDSARGRRFYSELYSLFGDNGMKFDFDIFDCHCQAIFEEYFTLSNDLILALFKIAYRFDLLVEIRADNNCVIVEFHKN